MQSQKVPLSLSGFVSVSVSMSVLSSPVLLFSLSPSPTLCSSSSSSSLSPQGCVGLGWAGLDWLGGVGSTTDYSYTETCPNTVINFREDVEVCYKFRALECD